MRRPATANSHSINYRSSSYGYDHEAAYVTRWLQTALLFGRHLTVVAAIVAGLTTLVSTLAAAESDGRRAVRSLLAMRQEKVVVQKWDLSCGAAALATLLTYQHSERPRPGEGDC